MSRERSGKRLTDRSKGRNGNRSGNRLELEIGRSRDRAKDRSKNVYRRRTFMALVFPFNFLKLHATDFLLYATNLSV